MSEFRQATPDPCCQRVGRKLTTDRTHDEILSGPRHLANSDCSPQNGFGIRLATVLVLVEAKSDGDGMGVLVRCSGVRYAVIQGLVKYRRVPYGILQSVLATGIVLFYSKNLICVTIRMALGAL